MRPTTSLLLILASLSLLGCAYGELREVVRVQFSSETGCTDVSVRDPKLEYYQPDENILKVEGCGELRTYTCQQVGRWVEYGETPCTWVKGDPDIPKLGQGARDRMDDQQDPFDDAPAEEEVSAEPEARAPQQEDAP